MFFLKRLKFKNFTDYELLSNVLYECQDSYLDRKYKKTNFYVPIDIELIAKKMATDAELIFQRLYNHLNQKYGYSKNDKSLVCLFLFARGDELHSINYPYLCAIHADLKDKRSKENWAIVIALAAFFVSIISLLKDKLA